MPSEGFSHSTCYTCCLPAMPVPFLRSIFLTGFTEGMLTAFT